MDKAALMAVMRNNAMSQEPVRFEGGFAYQTLTVGPLQCNCTIIADLETKEALIVDPGGDVKRVIAAAEALGVKIVDVYHTHGHFDHMLGSAELKEATKATLHIHEKDAFWWNSLERQLRGWGIKEPISFVKCDDFFKAAHDIRVGRLEGKALFTPGHTAGSVSYYFEQLGIVCTGDTLFKLTVGRTDLADGDTDLLRTSIRDTLYALPDTTKVIPGHGPDTRIVLEKLMNAFVSLDPDEVNGVRSQPASASTAAPHPCIACDHLHKTFSSL